MVRGEIMTLPYVGEIRLIAGSYAPVGWHICDGSLLPISANQALFNLIKTTYGGDGQSTFAVPDLRSRVPVGMGNVDDGNYQLGQIGGYETATLNINQMPVHSHLMSATDTHQTLVPGNTTIPAVATSSASGQFRIYYVGQDPLYYFSPQMMANQGGNQPHSNIQPYVALLFIIALNGQTPQPPP